MNESDGPLVTIGISTYNRANSYLSQALKSALAQTYPNTEILVSDNCSTDDTPELVRKMATPRLRYVRQTENIGPNNNFNFCLREAKGRFFLLLHDDDYIDPDFVASCIEAAQGDVEVGAIRTGTRVVDGDGRALAQVPNRCEGLSPSELFLAWFDRGTAFYLCSTLYNREKLLQHGGFHSRKNLFQDVTALANVVTRYGRVDVEGVKANFRRHDANQGSGTAALDWADDSLYLLSLLEELMPHHAPELRRAGLPYLCRKCYRNVSNIPGPVERWRTYLAIYRRFDRSYSPLKYAWERSVRDTKSGLRSLLRRDGSKRGHLQAS